MNYFIGAHPRFAVGVTSDFRFNAVVAVMLTLPAAIKAGMPFIKAEIGVLCSGSDVGPIFFFVIFVLESFEPIWRPAVDGRGNASARTSLLFSRPWRSGSCGNKPESDERMHSYSSVTVAAREPSVSLAMLQAAVAKSLASASLLALHRSLLP